MLQGPLKDTEPWSTFTHPDGLWAESFGHWHLSSSVKCTEYRCAPTRKRASKFVYSGAVRASTMLPNPLLTVILARFPSFAGCLPWGQSLLLVRSALWWVVCAGAQQPSRCCWLSVLLPQWLPLRAGVCGFLPLHPSTSQPEQIRTLCDSWRGDNTVFLN